MNKNEMIKSYTNEIVDNFRMSGKDELIVVCIGTDKCIGDCLAPMIGTLIEEQNSNVIIYGTLESPVHALNIHDRLEKIYSKHSKAYVIGIDACVGDMEDMGAIRLRDYGIRAGLGVGKDLPQVGDISMVGIIGSEENLGIFGNTGIRLSFVYDMAKTISKIVENTYIELSNLNNNIAITI